MAITQSEANELVGRCKTLWGNPFKVTSDTPKEWAGHAGSLEYKAFSNALDWYATQGSNFPPSLAEIVSKARSLTGPTIHTDRAPKSVCLYCGGPTRESYRDHYSWCYRTGDGDWILHDMYKGMGKSYSDPDHPTTGMPKEIRERLKES